MRDLSHIGAMLAKIPTDTPILKWAMAVAGGALAYVLPTDTLRSSAVAAFVLILLDTLTGVVASTYGDGQPISSAKFGRVLVKLIGYSSAIIVVAVVNNHLPLPTEAEAVTVGGVLWMILATEGISILENVRRMGLTLPFGIDRVFEERMTQPKGAKH